MNSLVICKTKPLRSVSMVKNGAQDQRAQLGARPPGVLAHERRRQPKRVEKTLQKLSQWNWWGGGGGPAFVVHILEHLVLPRTTDRTLPFGDFWGQRSTTPAAPLKLSQRVLLKRTQKRERIWFLQESSPDGLRSGIVVIAFNSNACEFLVTVHRILVNAQIYVRD